MATKEEKAAAAAAAKAKAAKEKQEKAAAAAANEQRTAYIDALIDEGKTQEEAESIATYIFAR